MHWRHLVGQTLRRPVAFTGVDDDTRAFGQLFQRFLEQIVHRSSADVGPGLVDKLEDHLGIDPLGLPVVVEQFAMHDHANVQVAIDVWLESTERPHELVGIAGSGGRHQSLTEILEMARRHRAFGLGPVDYVRVPTGVDSERDCVRFGLYLAESGEDKVAILMRGPHPHEGNAASLEVLATSTEATRTILTELRRLMAEHNVFRGQVISLDPGGFDSITGPIRFHPRPNLDRVDIILPAGVLELVERQVVGIARHRQRLLDAGQHLKRGVLMYGPPGTGKTHTARYLISSLPDFTVVLLTGQGIGLVGAACGLARMLQPALVVLEDCDLVAEERGHHRGSNPLLFEVLDHMDGMAADADVAFVLTTNRPDLLEPALAQRPGRIDVAVEIELPSEMARTRLFSLYGPALAADDAIRSLVVDRTAGVTASFLKELVRRATLLSAERGNDAPDRTDVEAALDEMLSSSDRLARSLVGGGEND